MPCYPFKSKDGQATGFICTGKKRTKKCEWCSSPGTKQCDYKWPENGKMCDRYMCAAHATVKGDNLDHCPIHKNFDNKTGILI